MEVQRLSIKIEKLSRNERVIIKILNERIIVVKDN